MLEVLRFVEGYEVEEEKEESIGKTLNKFDLLLNKIDFVSIIVKRESIFIVVIMKDN